MQHGLVVPPVIDVDLIADDVSYLVACQIQKWLDVRELDAQHVYMFGVLAPKVIVDVRGTVVREPMVPDELARQPKRVVVVPFWVGPLAPHARVVRVFQRTLPEPKITFHKYCATITARALACRRIGILEITTKVDQRVEPDRHIW